ncbi:acyl-CoA carboxylase epsilon subunit [Streptomyces sp. cg35]|uniref:acyl-CoA carboxylase epsilon subunit n=1 Tax=Streptomyces sp. cg35 TaxID=3421650 RepID=UPI003D172D25
MTTAIPSAAAAAPLVRIERGHATDIELAALTVLLLTRAAAAETTADTPSHAPQDTPRWDRPERHATYRFPGSWRRGM